MAAKHDGKRARANFWVAQQNLAKSKGGRPLFQHKPKPALTVTVTKTQPNVATANSSPAEDATKS